MNGDVQLQFTQTDRDMLRDVNRDVKSILDGMVTHNDSDLTKFNDLEMRLKSIETWQTRVMAIYVALGTVGGFVLKAVWK
jgi:hypothetical protein